MDLGIARDNSREQTPMPELSGLDDAAAELTRDGALMGSPGYMAAEQFSGGEVTAKTDQFSFCVSLWEALYGERPFESTNLPSLAEAVNAGRLRAPKRSEVPNAVRSVLERGLRVDPAARFESMSALLVALERAIGSRVRVRRRLAAAGVGVVALASVFVAVQAWTGDPRELDVAAPAEPPIEPAVVPVSESQQLRDRQLTQIGTASALSLSPDGNRLVYVSGGGFVHVDMRTGQTRALAPIVTDVLSLHVANDGSFMFSATLLGDAASQRGVWRMPNLDAEPIRVDDVLPTFCRFPDRSLVASIHLPHKIVRVSTESGEFVSEQQVEGEYEWMRDIACDPQGNRVVVQHTLGAVDTLKLIDLDGGPARVLFERSVALASPWFDQTGDTLYYLARLDGQTNLEATRVTRNSDDLAVTRVVVPNIDARAFSRASSGRIAHLRTRTVNHGVWRFGVDDRSMQDAERIMEADADDMFIAVSPDDTQLAYVESRRNLGRLMVRSLVDGVEREVTRADRLRHIAWSPDGQTLAFMAQYRGQAHVWTVPAKGSSPKVHKHALASDGPPLAWAPSERIIYQQPGNRNFGVLDPIREDEHPLISSETGWPFYPSVSPDGESVAVFWNRDQKAGVWAIDIDQGTERLLVEGGYSPLGWSADGRFLYAGEQEASPVSFVRIPASGGPAQEWRTIDFGPRRHIICQLSSIEELLCVVLETSADIWTAEGIE